MLQDIFSFSMSAGAKGFSTEAHCVVVKQELVTSDSLQVYSCCHSENEAIVIHMPS